MPPSADSSSVQMSLKNNPHGWVIVGLTLLMQTVSSGLGFYNMSVYINRLSAQLAVPSADTSFAVSLFFVVGGVAGLYVADLLRSVVGAQGGHCGRACVWRGGGFGGRGE